MQHAPWYFESTNGGHVATDILQMRPVDPIAYRMNDVWGYDSDELPIEPFDIEISVRSGGTPASAVSLSVLQTLNVNISDRMLRSLLAKLRKKLLPRAK